MLFLGRLMTFESTSRSSKIRKYRGERTSLPHNKATPSFYDNRNEAIAVGEEDVEFKLIVCINSGIVSHYSSIFPNFISADVTITSNRAK
jgi:hypothetical protein